MSTKRSPLPYIFKADEILPAMKSIISQYQTTYDKITQTATPSTACFDNVIRPLANLHNTVQADRYVIELLEQVAPDIIARKAATEALGLCREAEATWAARDDLFQLIKAASDKDEPLDAETELWLKRELLEYTISGHGTLSESEIQEYLAERTAISALVDRFFHHLDNEHGGEWFTEDELEGVPQWVLEKRGPPNDEGKIFIPFETVGLGPVTANAKREDTRRRLFLGNEKKLPEAAALVKEIAVRRDAQARKLGYSSHTAFRMEKMASPSAEWAGERLEKLREGLALRAQSLLDPVRQKRIEALKEQGLYEEGENYLPPWDVMFYKKQMLQKTSNGPYQIHEFFPLLETMAGMLDLFSSFLGLRFTKLRPEELKPSSVWHEDVEVWSVWDEKDSGAFLEYLYMDLFERPGKRPGCSCMNIQCGYMKSDMTRQCPVIAMVCSLSVSAAGHTLLDRGYVVTLFHELGHATHDLVSKTKYARFHGTRLADDVCETPSVMLENFCYMDIILKKLSCHYTTLKPEYLAKWKGEHPEAENPPKDIPDELVSEFLGSRRQDRLNQFIQQLVLAVFDWKMHNPPSHQAIIDLDLSRVFNEARAELRGIDDPHGRHHGSMPWPRLPAIVDGYDGVEFVYVSAAAFAQDIFSTTFADDPFSKEA